MTTKRFALVWMLLLLLTPALFAAEDFTGKWSGTLVVTVDGNPMDTQTAQMVLKHTGATVTGTVGDGTEQLEISDGKVETVKKDGKDVTNVTFTVRDPHDDSAPLFRFVLTFADGHLKGNAQADMEGRKLVAALDVTRVK